MARRWARMRGRLTGASKLPRGGRGLGTLAMNKSWVKAADEMLCPEVSLPLEV